MTHNIAKIRAALESALARATSGSRVAELRDAIVALAELEKAAAEPVAEVGGDFALYWVGTGPIQPLIVRHNIKVGSLLYAAPPAPVAEIREPTPEECERIYSFWLSAEGCNGRTPGERMGGLMSIAVRAVMWPKSEAK